MLLKAHVHGWVARMVPRRGKVAVYSVLTGNYDVMLPVMFRERGVEYFLFTDRSGVSAGGWTLKPIPPDIADLSPKLQSRWCKFFAHRILPEHEITVYIDANVVLRGMIAPLIDEFRSSGKTMGLFPHPFWSTLEDEIAACIKFGKFTSEDILVLESQMQRYASDGVDASASVTENAVIFRKAGDSKLDDAMTLWWQEFLSGAKRDQIALPWVRRVTALPCIIWPFSYRSRRDTFVGPFSHRTDGAPRRFEKIRHLRKVAKSVRRG